MHQTIDLHQTMGELARSYPVLIPFFEEKGLDFCCGGSSSVAQICAVNHWPSAQFLDEATARIASGDEGPVEKWEAGSEASLIDYILERFHEGHRRDFETAESLMAKILNTHGERWPLARELAEILGHMIDDVAPHMLKEEHVLFPLIKAKLGIPGHPFHGCVTAPHAPIQVMMMEHENVGRLLDELVHKSNDFTPPDWACNTVIGLYALLEKLNREIRLHVHMENNVLFPMVQAMDW